MYLELDVGTRNNVAVIDSIGNNIISYLELDVATRYTVAVIDSIS